MTRAVEVADHRAWYPLVLIFAILALGIFVGGIFSYRNYERRFRTGIEQQLSAIAELKVNDLALWRKERLGDASVLFKNASFSGLVRRFLDRPDDAEAQAQLRAWLEKFQAANRYECIFLLDAQGVERMSTAGTAGPVAAVVSRRAGEVLRSREVGFQDFYRNEQDQRIYLATLAPILDGPDFGQALGVLVLNIDPAIHLYPVISRWPTPSRTAETLLVRRDGHDALFLNELKFRTNAALKLRIPLERTNAPAVKAALGQQGIVEGIDYRSEPVVAALRAIPDSPWSMVARMDTAEVYAPLRERLWLTVLLMGALLLGAGASVGLLWRQQHVQFYRERAAASERLRESLQRFQLANRATFDAIWDWNLQTDAFWWNENFQTLFGYRAEEVEPDSESWKKRIHPEDLDRVKTGIQAAIDSGQDHWSDQYRFRRKDGTYAEVEDRSYIAREASGHPVRMIGAMQDTTERRQAEEKVRKSEERRRLALEAANAGTWSWDVASNVSTWDERYQAQYGFEPGEPASLEAWMTRVHPEDRQRLQARIRALLEPGPDAAWEQEFRALHPVKGERWMAAVGRVERDASGRAVRFTGINLDITERKQVQQRLQELNLVRQAAGAINALMMRERDPKRLLAEACKILVETRGYRFVWIGQVEPGSKRVVPAAHAGKEAGYLDAVTITWDETPTGQGPTGTAIRTGQPMACQDTATDPRFAPWKEEAMARGFASLAAMPMMHGSRVLGAVVVYAGHTEVFNAEELDLLKELAGDLAFALQSIEHEQEQKRAEAALRESSQFNQQIITSAQEGIIVYGRDLRYQVWNPFMEQMTGMSEDQVQGKHPDELFPFLREAGVLASIEKVLAGEPISSIEVHVEGQPTGISGWTFQTNGPLRNAAREIIGVIGIIRDITEPKRAELRIQAFSQLGQRLSTARSAAEAARAIYACADQFWKWDCGVLDLQVPESGQVETALAYDLVDGQRREVLPADRVGSPSAMNRRVMAQGAELILRKLDEPPATDTIRFGAASRLSASLMCVPVRVENRAVGVLSIQSYTPDAYTQEDLRMLRALADHCGGALDRLRMEALLHGSEVRYRRLFEAAKDGVLILDAETGMVVDVNPFLVQLLGFSREAFLGKKIWELGFFKDIVANHDRFKELQEAEYIRYDDKPLETADGRRIDVEFVSNVYEVNHHAVIQCNIRDITARKRSEWLGLIYKDQLRALSARIETMREAERTRISREIHDELGQMLTGIKMDLRWVEHRLDEFGEDRRVNPILDKLVVTAELADATIKVVQRIAAELRPGILDKLGLPTALQYEAARFEERTGIACRLVVPGDALPLRPEVATAFFRIFEETLTNVTRHAKATAVEVELQPVADDWRLEIRDNGQGMAGVDLQNPKSLGLLGMQERASLLGGGVSFAPRPGGGTVVTVRIPNSQTQRGGV
jgi:PAS domain S-box-containing protein